MFTFIVLGLICANSMHILAVPLPEVFYAVSGVCFPCCEPCPGSVVVYPVDADSYNLQPFPSVYGIPPNTAQIDWSGQQVPNAFEPAQVETLPIQESSTPKPGNGMDEPIENLARLTFSRLVDMSNNEEEYKQYRDNYMNRMSFNTRTE